MIRNFKYGLVLFTIFSVQAIATSPTPTPAPVPLVKCEEPARTVCINSCISANCRAACQQSYCTVDNSVPPPPPIWVPPQPVPQPVHYGWDVPLYYGPFLYGYDKPYLTALYNDLLRQKKEVEQFRDIAYQIGDPMFIRFANQAYQDIENKLSQLQIYQYPYPTWAYVTN